MKNLFLSSALSIVSLAISPSVLAGPGELLGNTKNDCNTSSGSCLITPTKFSAKIYQVALCTSHPMPEGSALDLAGSGCIDVYKSDAGEETGDIFSDAGATLSAANISIPVAGNYTHVAAIFDKDFKVGSHHKIYDAGDSESPLGDRYYSTSSGGAAIGTADQVEMISGEFNTFMPQIACSNGAGSAERTATSGTSSTYTNFLAGGETFSGRVLKPDFSLATEDTGTIDNGTASCVGAKYLLSIVDKATIVDENTTGVHIKLLAPKGLIRAVQGEGAQLGVVTGFTAHGESIAVKVVPITASN
tara:strand:+ start:200 stop:1108 length:909 start_codon:yes stop_codon:yes gene_type:complete